MSNFIIILLCFALGYLFRALQIVKEGDYKGINVWIINVGLPSIALRFIPQIDWNTTYIFTIGLPFLVFLFSYSFFYLLKIWLLFSKRTFITLVLVSGLSNTSFIGFPLIVNFFGETYLSVGVVSDQATFFILSSLGVLLASQYRNRFHTTWDQYSFILKRILLFPPFVACIMALIWGQFLQADILQSALTTLSMTVTPLALFSIGIQVRLKNLNRQLRLISFSMLYKLLLAPLLMLLFALVLNKKGVFYQVSVFEMAMPSLVASGILVERFDLNTKLANAIIGLSIIFGLAFSFVWYCILSDLL